MVGEDEKELKQAERYASPQDIWKKARELERRVSSGELRSAKPLAKDATPEQVAAYRTENGIPANAGDYLANMPNGLVIGEADKPVMTAFADAMHKANAPPALVHAALGWYNSFQEQQAADIVKAEKEGKQKGEDTLRATWGADYRTNLNLANDFVTNTAGEELADELAHAVLPDGSLLGDNPKAMEWLAKIAREVNPVATLLPNSGGGNAASIDTAITELEKFMRTNRAEYNKDQAKQSQLRDLYSAREKVRQRKIGG